MMKSNEKMNSEYDALVKINEVISTLIAPETGCEWDREQSPLSLCEYLIEECHELVDAIRQNKPGHACDEMGDLLFLLIFTAKRYAEAGHFSLSDALNAGAAKMTRRHPHIFGSAEFTDRQDFFKAWGEIKKAEKQAAGEDDQGALASVPYGLPPLTKAYRLMSKAKATGFTWDTDDEVERQVESEWLELLDAKASGNLEDQKHELGDMFISLVELGRRMGIKGAEAADQAANRFRTRFEAMEKLAAERGLDFSALPLDDKDDLWNEVKAAEKAATHDLGGVKKGKAFVAPKFEV